jgi:hypothetical protein
MTIFYSEQTYFSKCAVTYRPAAIGVKIHPGLIFWRYLVSNHMRRFNAVALPV